MYVVTADTDVIRIEADFASLKLQGLSRDIRLLYGQIANVLLRLAKT